MPTDVLGLGRHLVRELGLGDGVDTLGRWMAHHVAELINEAENGATPAARLRAREEATETILRIWEHRASLPGNAYPLARYKDVLEALDRLRPDSNPFLRFLHATKATREQLAADLFDGLSRLIIALLLMKLPSGETSMEVDVATADALSETEQQVLGCLQQWSQLFISADTSTEQALEDEEGGAPEVLGKAAVQLIDSITATLAELRADLESS